MTLTDEDRALIESVLKGDAADAISQDLFTLDEVIALLSAARQARTQPPREGWEPIETAPCDGETVVLGSANWDGVTAREWNTEAERQRDLDHWFDPPTHWMRPKRLGFNPSPTREAGWLVEHYASKRGEYLAEWLVGWPAFDDSAPETWTKDSAKAIRFARREDAEQVIQALGWTEARATEHVWSAPPASQIKEG